MFKAWTFSVSLPLFGLDCEILKIRTLILLSLWEEASFSLQINSFCQGLWMIDDCQFFFFPFFKQEQEGYLEMRIGQWLKNTVGIRSYTLGVTTFGSCIIELIRYCWKFLLELVILTGKGCEDFREMKYLCKRDKVRYLGVKMMAPGHFWDLLLVITCSR